MRSLTCNDEPAHKHTNAYLDITETTVNKCNQGQGNCQDSDFMYGRTAGILWDPVKKACYLPNAAIAWKQPNGFYYPPSFHSRNLFFNNVDIRHLVVEPLFNPGTREQDDDAVRAAYCTFVTDPFFGMFGANFSAVDRQTILNDDDGSLTAYRHTISVNTDEFFTAPVETTECRSGTLNLLGQTKPRTATVTGTAKTSPYEYVTTAVYPACAATGCGPRMCTADTMNTADCCINNSEDPPKCTIPVKFNQSCEGGNKCFSLWSVDCANQSCFGVPLYRQLVTRAEKAEIDQDKHDITKRPSIQMAAMSIFQRSNLTANNGTYYIDTTPSIKQQVAVRPPSSPIVNLNVFEKKKTYYVYQIFAKPHTRTTYQIYVGGDFDKNNDNQLWAITTPLRNTPLDFPKTNWPMSWERRYGPNDPCVPPRANCPKLPHGVLEVTVDMHDFAKSFADAKPANCGPASFCKWNENWTATPNKCRCTSSDPVLLKECQEKFIDPKTGKEVYDDVVCAWGVADIDCPVPGCYGFAVTLTDDFEIGQRMPPDVNLFPQDKNWDVPLKLGPDDLLGDCPTTRLGSGACVVEASFASLECRSDALALRLQGATDLGRTKDRLVRQAAKLDERLRDAEAQMVAGDARKVRIRLKKARRVLIAIGFRLRSLTGRRQIGAATRAELQTTIAGLDTDLRALRRTV